MTTTSSAMAMARVFHNRRMCCTSFLRGLVMLLAGFWVVAPVSAATITPYLNHGAATTSAPLWIEFNGATYFVAETSGTNREVRRLDSGSQQPVTVAAFAGLVPEDWVVFQNAIVFLASNGLHAFRSNGTIETIDSRPQGPVDFSPVPGGFTQTEEYQTPLKVFENRVWVVLRTYQSLAGVGVAVEWAHLLELDDLEAKPVVVDGLAASPNSSRHSLGPLRVEGDYLFTRYVNTTAGLAATSVIGTNAIAGDGAGYSVTDFGFGRTGPSSLFTLDFGCCDLITQFDGALFYSGVVLYDVPFDLYPPTAAGDVVPSIGPFDAPNDPGQRSQIELLRQTTNAGTDRIQHYELYPMTINQAFEDQYYLAKPGSSRPANFRTTDNALWFTASPDGAGRELYRIRSGSLVPERLGIQTDSRPIPYESNPNSGFAFVAKTDNHLWFTALTTNGEQLFFMAEDATTAQQVDFTSLGITTPQEFVPRQDELQFNARDNSGDYITYRIAPNPVNEAGEISLSAVEQQEIAKLRLQCRIKRLKKREVTPTRVWNNACFKLAARHLGLSATRVKAFLKAEYANQSDGVSSLLAPVELEYLDARAECVARRAARVEAGDIRNYKNSCTVQAANRTVNIGKKDARALWLAVRNIEWGPYFFKLGTRY